MGQDASFDLLITAAETNSHHGVGIFLQRLFPDSSRIVCLRTVSLYGGEEPFGAAHHELYSRFLTLPETEELLRPILASHKIRRILCVPFYREEFVHAFLARQITGAPLCTFLMDDQNIYAPSVPDHWVQRLLKGSDLRMGISPEMCAAYQKKFGLPVHLLPPVLEKAEPLVPCYWQPGTDEPIRAAMIGNVWTARRFTQLRELTRSANLTVDWYGNGPQASWLTGTPEEWEADNIFCRGFLPEEDLVAALASYPFVLVPSGGLDADDDNPAFSRLSLPSRLLFLHARTDTPVLLLGHGETAAGRFVRRLQTGLCSSTDPAQFSRQVARLLDPEVHRQLRQNIRRCAPSLNLPAAGEWLWRSLAARQPEPAAFQRLFPDEATSPDGALAQIPPVRAFTARVYPAPGEPFRDEHAASFGFLHVRHLPVLATIGQPQPPRKDIEFAYLNQAITLYILRGSLPAGGDILFIGEDDIGPLLKHLPPTFRFWRFADLAAWKKAGFAGDPKHIVDASTGAAYPPAFPQFSAIISYSWFVLLGENSHDHAGLALYLDACTRPGGFNLHLFSGAIHPTYFWVAPAYTHLRQRFLGHANWPDLDELLLTDDPFVMSEAAYDRHWKSTVGKSYADFGRPLALSLFWRKSPGN